MKNENTRIYLIISFYTFDFCTISVIELYTWVTLITEINLSVLSKIINEYCIWQMCTWTIFEIGTFIDKWRNV